MMDNPLPGLYSWFAGPDTTGPSNRDAMEARRRIALNLMVANARKGYPKTLGEGLTAIGDAIGERGIMNQLAQQENAYQGAINAEAAKSIPAEARTAPDTSVVPERKTSSYAPVDDTVEEEPAVRAIDNAVVSPVRAPAPPPNAPIQMTKDNKVSGNLTAPIVPPDDQPDDLVNPNPVTGVPLPMARPSGAPAAPAPSLSPAELLRNSALQHLQGGSVQVPQGVPVPPSLQPVPQEVPAPPSLQPGPQLGPRSEDTTTSPDDLRNRITALAMLTGRGVPQQNPILAGSIPASLQPATPATSPSIGIPPPDQRLALTSYAPGSGTVSDIQPAPPLPSQLRPAPQQVAQATKLPQPSTEPMAPAPLAQLPPRVEPRLPDPKNIPMTDDEKRGWNIRARGMAMGDPNIQAMGDALVKQGQQQHDQLYNAMMQKYQDDKQSYDQYKAAEETWRRGGGPAEADILARTGGVPGSVFFPRMDLRKSEIDKTVQAQDAQRIARDAIRSGVITGYGADFKLAAAKFANFALKNQMSGDLATNTETLKAMLTSGLSQAIHAVNGSGQNVSDRDVKVAMGMTGTPEQQKATILNIMDRASAINNASVNQYEGDVERFLSGHLQEGTYRTNARPVAPDDHLKTLLDSQKSDPQQAASIRAYFDRTYGPGSADLEISRAARAERARQRQQNAR